jgi:hypothetical protein
MEAMNKFLLRSLVIVAGLVAILSLVWDGSITKAPASQLNQVSFNQKIGETPAETSVIGPVHTVAYSPQISLPELLDNPLSRSDMRKANGLAGSVAASEWLGPLAPIAISPFFGVTLLAGLAQFGADWMPVNEFLSNNAVLKNPAVFWVFLVLTLLTSIPRFTKVSKPAAQAIDQLEAYAGIITIILLRVMMMPEEAPMAEGPIAMQAGLLSMTADTLMCVAAIINIVVINTVKFFFEVSVWLIPFPFVDAMLEVANKSACVALMAVYAYNPFIATILNLIIFTACLIAFRWIHRRTVYLRTMLLDPVVALAWPRYGIPKKQRITVFNKEPIGPFTAKSKLLLMRQESGWKLVEQRLLLPGKSMEIDPSSNLTIHRGVLGNKFQFSMSGDSEGDENELVFSRRYSGNLDELAKLLGVGIHVPVDQPQVTTGDLSGQPLG